MTLSVAFFRAAARLPSPVLLAAFIVAGAAAANPEPESARVLTIDASTAVDAPETGYLRLGGRSPNGHEIGANSRYLTLDGKPWMPVMGEFHFSRYSEPLWEEELLKMKAGGVQIVATYLFWIHHEEIEGQFDWSGQRNLRRFVELCAKHGLYAYMRLGPWAHGECRNGGSPDWLLRKCAKPRSNDPCYLSAVRTYFREVGEQLKGLYWKDGGPVVGAQLENEYYPRGPEEGATHLAELKKIAHASGIDVPLYTVTGWGNPDFPPDEFIPVFGAPSDGFWQRSLCAMPPSVNYFFNRTRDDGAIGADLQDSASTNPQISRYPFLTAETGGGMIPSYHRRPVVNTDDITAIVFAKLGSGANLLGYYMFHGGSNPQGKLSTMNESQATGYPNDLPVISYDFQAPLGAFGQIRPSYGVLKTLHLFLHDFGSELAPMVSVRPAEKPLSIYDRETPRVAARSDGERAFVFVNNSQRNYPLPAHPAVQVALKLRSETVHVPRNPVAIPAGAYFLWPVNLAVNGALLKYATAQLLCKLSQEDADYYLFFAWPGITPEFAFDERTIESLETEGVRSRGEGRSYASVTKPGTGVAMTVHPRAGRAVKIVVLSLQQARDCYKVSVAGRERIFLSPSALSFDGDRISLRSPDVGKLVFSVFPPLESAPHASVPLRPVQRDGLFHSHAASVQPKGVPLTFRKVRAASPLGPPKMKQEVILAPDDTDFETKAAEWRITVPRAASDGLDELLLRIRYTGDVARLYLGPRLLDDNFYDGRTWEVGLKRFAKEVDATGLTLKVLPLGEGAPIFLPENAWPKLLPGGRRASVGEITTVPVYAVNVDAARPGKQRMPPGRD